MGNRSLALAGVEVDLGTLTRLVAAVHASGCESWAEAENKAEDDIRPWYTQLAPGQHRVQISRQVLIQIAEAAQAVLNAHADLDELWVTKVVADLDEVAQLCRPTR